MSTTADTFGNDLSAEYAQYRTLSLTAIATLVLAVVSVTALLIPELLFLPVIGTFVGIYSVAKIRRRQEEYTGLGVAKAGLLMCLVLAAGGISWNMYVLATEVPEGFDRISFYSLQPSPDYPNLPIPPEAINLNGKKIFVKGYVYPDGQPGNIKRFVLIPDLKTCCFGGQPKLTDMIEVTLRDPLRIDYSLQMRKLAGVLKVSPAKKPVNGLDGVYYQLDAEYIK
jgi:hypothetical protein